MLHTHILGQSDCYTTHTHTHTHRSVSSIRETGTAYCTAGSVSFSATVLSPTINYAFGSGSASDPFF